MKMVHASEEHLEKHYADLKGKPFFPGLVKYMASGPVVALVFQGKQNRIERSRNHRLTLPSSFRQRRRQTRTNSSWRYKPSRLITRNDSWRLVSDKRFRTSISSSLNVFRVLCSAIDVGRNICHGSDSVESAKKEIALWFGEQGATIPYTKAIDTWVYE